MMNINPRVLRLDGHVLISIVIMALITFPSCDEMDARPYYLSNNGIDQANGMSPRTAWKTIAKLNSVKLSPGDTVYFEAGSVWRETLEIKESGAHGNKIVYTRYGEGANPKIVGSNLAESWTQSGNPNIWQSGSNLDDPRGKKYPGEIYFIQNDSVIWGIFKETDNGLLNLKKDTDWTFKDSKLYIYCESDPAIKYDRVEATQRSSAVRMIDRFPVSYIEWDGIDMMFSRTEGFNSGYPAVHGATDLIFRNCYIGYIGEKGSGRAYGLALFHSNLIVENCTITDCGRRGISFNLYLQRTKNENRNINNVTVRNNVFKRGYHTTSLDLACMNITGDTIQDVYFYNNLIDDSELRMEDNDATSNQIFTQGGGSYMNRIYIFNNIFVHATARNILIEGGDSIFIWNNTIVGHNPNITTNPYANVSLNFTLNVDFRNNILVDNLLNNRIQNHGLLMERIPGTFIEKDYNLYFSLFPKANRNFSAHRPNGNQQADIGFWNTNAWKQYLFSNPKYEQHSPVPANPMFVDELNDFRLQSGSPALGQGVPIGLIINDFYGRPMNNPPDLGAIQFQGALQK